MTALPTVARRECSPAQLAAADAWPEEELQRGVLHRGAAFGWRRQHQLPVRHVAPGGRVRYRTAYAGDGGWPDTALVHPAGVLLVVELKTERGSLDREQRAWLELLAGVPGVLAGVWRPRDWFAGVVFRVLSDPEATARLARGEAA